MEEWKMAELWDVYDINRNKITNYNIFRHFAILYRNEKIIKIFKIKRVFVVIECERYLVS